MALLALGLLLLLQVCPAHAEEERLLVLTGEASGGAAEQTTERLRSLALYNNWQCDFADAQAAVELSDYSAVILCVDRDATLAEESASAIRESGLPVFVIDSGGLEQLAECETVSGSLVIRLETEDRQTSDLLVYGNSLTLLAGEGRELGGEIYVGAERYALCRTVGNVTQMAYFDAQYDELCAELATLIQAWLWPYRNAPTAYGQYLVLDNVYPFMDPARLMEISEMLEDEGVPYAVCAMPLYANAEYPAMKRFCEYLRYVQSRGNGIILHVPLISLANVEADEVKEYMDIAFGGYVDYGVYPVALEAPEPWLRSEKGLDILAGCRTVFLFESDESVSGATLSTNLARRDGHQLIASAYLGSSAFTTAYAQAIYLDVNQDVETLRTQVRRLKSSRRVLKSLTDMENIFYSGDHVVQEAQATGYRYDNAAVSISYEPFVYEDYQFDRGFTQYLTEQIQTSNKWILGFVFIACCFFVAAIFLSRRMMRRELLRGGGDRPYDDDEKGAVEK